MTVESLQVGDTVVFESVPPCSYLKTGKLYRVEHIGERDVHFRSQTGSGTFDSKSMLRQFASFYMATC
jgi:hypothetical protein